MHPNTSDNFIPHDQDIEQKVDEMIDILLALLHDGELEGHEFFHSEWIAWKMGLSRGLIDKLFLSTLQTLSEAYMLHRAGVYNNLVTRA